MYMITMIISNSWNFIWLLSLSAGENTASKSDKKGQNSQFSLRITKPQPPPLLKPTTQPCRKRHANSTPPFTQLNGQYPAFGDGSWEAAWPYCRAAVHAQSGGPSIYGPLAGCQIKCLFLLRPRRYVWASRPGPEKHARALASVSLSVVLAPPSCPGDEDMQARSPPAEEWATWTDSWCGVFELWRGAPWFPWTCGSGRGDAAPGWDTSSFSDWKRHCWR